MYVYLLEKEKTAGKFYKDIFKYKKFSLIEDLVHN